MKRRVVATGVAVAITMGAGVAMQAQESKEEIPENREIQFGPPNSGYALGIRTSKDVYTWGERILLQVDLKNVSEQEVMVNFTNRMSKFRMEVVMPDGKIAPTTLYGEWLKRPAPWRRTVVQYVQPGKAVNVDFDLNRIFDMSRAGKYTVRVSSPIVYNADVTKVVAVKSVDLQLEVKTTPESWD
ncbi:hypothetical protein EON80_15715 [bacterium]|nr:MAG: hypothetical protein EON80_15715 [bacterium]